MKVLKISRWKTPATAYQESSHGKAAIRRVRYSQGVYGMYRVPTPQGCFDYFQVTRAIKVTCLNIDGKTWMVDDPPHWYAMLDHASHFKGRVLCAGLGLGLIVPALQANPAVTDIVVVERELDVIALVQPLLRPEKFGVVHADWYDFLDHAAFEPDGIFFDLFVGDGRDLLPLAMREMIQTRQAHPESTVRIHGFCNDSLNRMADAVLEGERAFAGGEPCKT